jgi:hypothetical protein
MFPHKSLALHVKEMRGLGEILVAYNHPKVPPEEEDDILIFKSRDIIVDGYSIIIFYSKSDHGRYFLETLQILGQHHPFLPFWVVVKIVKAFLGSNHLSLVEIFKEGKKIYCWSVAKDGKNEAVACPYKVKVKDCVYEGLYYKTMNPNEVNFY